jgi:hypothetical protein
VEGQDKLESCITERSSRRSKILIKQTTFTSDIEMRGVYTQESLKFEIPGMRSSSTVGSRDQTMTIRSWQTTSARTGGRLRQRGHASVDCQLQEKEKEG